MKLLRLVCVAALLVLSAVRIPAEDAAAKPPVKPDADAVARGWWDAAKTEIRAALKDSGRTEDDLEQPAWYAMPYNTLGRMPLVDTALAKPLDAPEIALWADKQARDNCYSFAGLLNLADNLANATTAKVDPPDVKDEKKPEHPKEWIAGGGVVATSLQSKEGIPERVRQEVYSLVGPLGHAALSVEMMLRRLSPIQRAKLENVLLRGFLLPAGSGEQRFRAFTAPMGDIPELMSTFGQVDFVRLTTGLSLLARELGQVCRNLRDAMADPQTPQIAGVLFSAETSIGRVIIGGTGNDTYTEDAALIVDLGGDDKYFNNAGGSRPGCPVSVVIDVSGDDLYQGGDCCQGCGVAGVGILADLAGNDRYIAGNYSQGCALGGVGMLLDWSGDDDYIADIAAQSYAAFGYSVLSDAKGTDNYRIKAMGLGCASTLGVAIMADGEGDDGYRAGGYPGQGFYKDYDASFCCGAATGMREWPPTGKTTLYGGVGFFSDGAGNDRYNTYAFANGAGYLFSLGMCVESGGNDVYTGMFYTQGCGCHMGAGVCIDRGGNDIHTGGFGGEGFHHTGAVVDRGVGILLEIGGNDIYEGGGGTGFATKPSGCAICVDTAGNDTYLGDGTNGKAYMPLSDSTQSQAFFLDFGGKDNYPKPEFKDNATWRQDDFGMSRDMELAEPPARTDGWKPPEKLEGKGSVSTFERFHTTWREAAPAAPKFDCPDAMAIASAGHRYARADVIDFVGQLNVAQRLSPQVFRDLRTLMVCDDPRMRLLYVWALIQAECNDKDVFKDLSTRIEGEKNPIVRGLIATAIGTSKLDTDFTINPLLKLEQDPHWFVRRRAVAAFKNFPKKIWALWIPSGVVEREKDFRVLAQAPIVLAGAKLDQKSTAECENVLKKLMAHENGFVQGEAVWQLVMTFPTAENFGEAVKRATSTNKPLRDLKVLPLLGRVTGLTMKPEEWAAWWDKNQKTFDVAKAVALAKEINDAEALYNKGRALEAVDAMRHLKVVVDNLRDSKDAPLDHADPKRLLIGYLGGLAADAALLGRDIAAAREWADELVTFDPTAAHYELKADLEHQSFDNIAANKSLEKAIELADEPAKETLRKRLKEWSKPAKKK
ncbi:MAG: HEAT repeat domain-containing protein [Planctomycetes bacterium]|nr:HEAT repeat domain-containing protein [Planctomycetota bacterium]